MESEECHVVHVSTDHGDASLELLPLSKHAARAFVRCSPRSLRTDRESSEQLVGSLADTGYPEILAQDNRAKFLERAISPTDWMVEKAISPHIEHKYTIVSTGDLPLEEDLVDHSSEPVDLTDTSHMIGLQFELDGRSIWAFYSDEGEAARVIPSGDRRTGMLIGLTEEDARLAADNLVRFLVTAKKSWAVFPMELGDLIGQFRPTTTYRMELEDISSHDHAAEPLSRENRKEAVSLFSEYYDESWLSALFRVRKLASDKAYSVFLADGGFVIVRFDNDLGLVYDIYVTPSRQGEGIGNELMKCAISAFSGRVEKAYLHTSYPRAKRLYKKFGFTEKSSHLVVRLDEILVRSPPSR